MMFLPPQTEMTRAWAQRLGREVEDVEVVLAEHHVEALAAIDDIDAAFGSLTAELTHHAHRLRWLQAPQAAPPAGFFHEALVDHPVVVTNFRGIYNDHVATHAVALILGLARGLQRYLPVQGERLWRQHLDPGSVIHLPEATALIIGVGEIGAAIAHHLREFGTRVVGTDPRVRSIDGVELRPPKDLDDLLPQADVVVLTIPYTPETARMIDARRLGLLRAEAVLVNVGRGGTVELGALAQALSSGVLAGAGLDVYEKEPLPDDHPLWTTPNVLLSPHVAHVGPYLDERRFDVIADNTRRFLAGRTLRNIVDKRRWY